MPEYTRRSLIAHANLIGFASQLAAQKRVKGREVEKGASTSKNSMKTVVKNLSAEISVTPAPASLEELRVTVSVRNESSSAPLRFNAQYFTAPALMLKFEDSQGKPVPTGGPPMPAHDDGKVGRVDLSPGQAISHTYEGNLIFGAKLRPGKYLVRFLYWNGTQFPGEWSGTLETPRVEFELGAGKR